MMQSIELTVGLLCPGLLVNYRGENGVVKLRLEDQPYVVYKCGGQWELFGNYTSQKTPIKDLELGWIDPPFEMRWIEDADIARFVPTHGLCRLYPSVLKGEGPAEIMAENGDAWIFEDIEGAVRSITEWKGQHNPPGALKKRK